MDPDDAPPRAFAYLAFNYLRAGNAMRSIQLAHQALQGSLEPDLLVDLHYSLAEAHVNQGEFSEALKESDITLSFESSSGRTVHEVGLPTTINGRDPAIVRERSQDR